MPKDFTDADVNKMKKAHITCRKEVGSKILTNSKVKEYFKSLGMRSDKELVDGIADAMYKAMWKGCARAMSNKRSTVRSEDISGFPE